jgi:hypothetical protein
MNKLETLIELYGDDFNIAVGFDKAILGIDETEQRVIYSAKKCVQILMKGERLTYNDALDFYNEISKPNTRHNKNNQPIFCNDLLL